MEEAGSLYGNFKLSLQSVVCHRGTSVDSGHYISLVRGTPPPNSANGAAASTPTATWMRFDDLAPSRVTVVDIDKALKEETPYLLFYQIVPVEGDPGHITSGEESIASAPSERNASISDMSSVSVSTENQPISGRTSSEMPVLDGARGRSPVESRRTSVISFSDKASEPTSDTALNVPKDPDILTRTERLNQTFVRNNASGLGRTLSKLTKRKSHEVQLNFAGNGAQPEVHVTELREQPLTDKTTPKPNNLHPEHHDHHKGHKREKSHGRLARSKNRGDKPDRECIVM